MKISPWTDTEEEKQEILDLTKKTFGPKTEISNPAYFDWQYRYNPSGKAIVLLARDDSTNQIIGTNTIVPMKLLIDGEIITSSLGCNVQVHPDYQKKNFFTKLLLSMPKFGLEQKIESLFAIPNDNSFKAFINTGSIEITHLPLLIKPINFSQYFPSPIKEITKPFDFLWKKNNHSMNNVEEFHGSFDDSFEKLVQKTNKRISIMNNRTKEFLNWRYKNHPTRKYKIFILRENNILNGYIITCIRNFQKKKIGVIVDYMVDSNYKDKIILKSLIDKALDNFRNNHVSLAIVTSQYGLIENKLLRGCGFFSPPSFLKPTSFHFIIQTFEDHKHTKLKKYDNWFFGFGDYDVF